MNIAIEKNTNFATRNCWQCSKKFTPRVPYEAFIFGMPVCIKCSNKIDPVLTALLNDFHNNQVACEYRVFNEYITRNG